MGPLATPLKKNMVADLSERDEVTNPGSEDGACAVQPASSKLKG